MNKSILITGGVGFIGTNASLSFARKGWKVTVLDNFSRKGAEANLDWLKERAAISVVRGDVRDRQSVE